MSSTTADASVEGTAGVGISSDSNQHSQADDGAFWDSGPGNSNDRLPVVGSGTWHDSYGRGANGFLRQPAKQQYQQQGYFQRLPQQRPPFQPQYKQRPYFQQPYQPLQTQQHRFQQQHHLQQQHQQGLYLQQPHQPLQHQQHYLQQPYNQQPPYAQSSQGNWQYNNCSGNFRGRWSDSFRPGGRGYNSNVPKQSIGLVPWVQQGCWLVPRQGSSHEGAYNRAAAAAVAPAGHAAADAAADALAAAVRTDTQDDDVVIVDTGGSTTACSIAASSATAAIAVAEEDHDRVTVITAGSTVTGTTSAGSLAAGSTGAAARGRQIDDIVLVDHETSSTAAVDAKTSSSSSSSSSSSNNRVVIIMRGLPGSGKSTRAAQIAAEAATTQAAASVKALTAATAFLEAGPAVAIHSTDSYFVDATGAYRFNSELLGINHQKNFDAFCQSLAKGVNTIIVDNTNLQPWQYEKYVLAAWAAGYKVQEDVVGEFTKAAVAEYATRNVHGVPYEKLLVMLDQWRQQ